MVPDGGLLFPDNGIVIIDGCPLLSKDRLLFLNGIIKGCLLSFEIFDFFSLFLKALIENLALLVSLVPCILQFLDLSCGTYETMNAWCEPTSYELGWRKDNAKAVKEAVSIPVGQTGMIRTPEQAEKLLEEGYQDVIGLARPLLADPYWGKKAKEGRSKEISRCIACLYCIESMMHNALAGGLPGQCAVNPRTCNEIDYPLVPEKNGNGKQVFVIGAGPAGLMAAKVCAEKGFKVTVPSSKRQTKSAVRSSWQRLPHRRKRSAGSPKTMRPSANSSASSSA